MQRVATDGGGTFTDLVYFEEDKKTGKQKIFPIKDPVEQLQHYRDKLFENLPEIAWDSIADQNKLKLISLGRNNLK